MLFPAAAVAAVGWPPVTGRIPSVRLRRWMPCRASLAAFFGRPSKRLGAFARIFFLFGPSPLCTLPVYFAFVYPGAPQPLLRPLLTSAAASPPAPFWRVEGTHAVSRDERQISPGKTGILRAFPRRIYGGAFRAGIGLRRRRAACLRAAASDALFVHRGSVLPRAAFGFRLAADTLASGYQFPLRGLNQNVSSDWILFMLGTANHAMQLTGSVVMAAAPFRLRPQPCLRSYHAHSACS